MSLSRARFSNPPGVFVLYYKSTGRLEVQNLKDEVTQLAITTATVTAVVKDEDGDPVSGIDNPLTLSHVGSATYRGLIPHTAGLAINDRATAEITADDGADRVAYWERTIAVMAA